MNNLLLKKINFINYVIFGKITCRLYKKKILKLSQHAVYPIGT